MNGSKSLSCSEYRCTNLASVDPAAPGLGSFEVMGENQKRKKNLSRDKKLYATQMPAATGKGYGDTAPSLVPTVLGLLGHTRPAGPLELWQRLPSQRGTPREPRPPSPGPTLRLGVSPAPGLPQAGSIAQTGLKTRVRKTSETHGRCAILCTYSELTCCPTAGE